MKWLIATAGRPIIRNENWRYASMISKEQFGEWRQHPATQFFWKYLKDRKKQMTEEAYAYFMQGKFDSTAHMMRGQIFEVALLEDVTFDFIQLFYQELENADNTNINISS